MIQYVNSAEGVSVNQLRENFFVGWPDQPSKETFLSLLQQSDFVVLALYEKRVVGFITAISDSILSAYIPFLEVTPEYQGKGIGAELTKRMLEQLKRFYMVDLLCDEELQPFYEGLGMKKATGMRIRNYDRQSAGPNINLS